MLTIPDYRLSRDAEREHLALLQRIVDLEAALAHTRRTCDLLTRRAEAAEASVETWRRLAAWGGR